MSIQPSDQPSEQPSQQPSDQPSQQPSTQPSDQPSTQSDQAAQFLARHTPGSPLLMPNAWDIGSAKLFAALNIKAIATTSGGFAASRGRLDGAMSKHEVLAHSQELATAVDIPVSADLENCFAHDPEGVAATIKEAIATGLAGGSVEDFTGKSNDERGDFANQPIYELAQAADRVRAAAEAAHRGPVHFVLTARAENYLHGRTDLADTINRLQAFQEAGADVLFAPGVVDPKELEHVIKAVDIPVSVLMLPNGPDVSGLAELGVARISVGGAVAVAAYGAAIKAIIELQEQGTASYWELTKSARSTIQAAFTR